MNHLHTYIRFEKNGSLNILLDNPANVYLMEDKEYENYKVDKEFNSLGGFVKVSSKKIKSPAPGNWHLVVDDAGRGTGINISLQLENGEVIPYGKKGEKKATEKEIAPASKNDLPPKKKKALKTKLIKELTGLIKDIEPDGLEYLVRQANILLRNQKVDQINKDIDEYNKEVLESRTKKKTVRKKTAKKGTSLENDTSIIDLLENNENSFILVFKGVRKILSRQELRNILKICHEPMKDDQFCDRIFQWMKTKRNDILFDSKTRNSRDPAFVLLRRFLASRYKPKE